MRQPTERFLWIGFSLGLMALATSAWGSRSARVAVVPAEPAPVVATRPVPTNQGPLDIDRDDPPGPAYIPQRDRPRGQQQPSPSESDSESTGGAGAEVPCGRFTGRAFASNRGGNLPVGTMQLAAFYDGQQAAPGLPVTLELELQDAQRGSAGWLRVGGDRPGGQITKFDSGISTWSFELGSCHLTGRVRVAGVVPDGVIDGLAIGLLHREPSGWRLLRSVHAEGEPGELAFVGLWPVGMDPSTWGARAPQITDGHGMQQLIGMLTGAAYLPSGESQLR